MPTLCEVWVGLIHSFHRNLRVFSLREKWKLRWKGLLCRTQLLFLPPQSQAVLATYSDGAPSPAKRRNQASFQGLASHRFLSHPKGTCVCSLSFWGTEETTEANKWLPLGQRFGPMTRYWAWEMAEFPLSWGLQVGDLINGFRRKRHSLSWCLSSSLSWLVPSSFYLRCL